jgi:hypothetical protein
MTSEITILTGQGERQVFPPPAPPPASFLKRVAIRVVAGLILITALAATLVAFAVAIPIVVGILVALALLLLLIVAIARTRQTLQRMGFIKPRPGVDFPSDHRENVRVRRPQPTNTPRDVIDPH